MLPLPYPTKENYKVLLYRLQDHNPDKVQHYSTKRFIYVTHYLYEVNNNMQN